MQDSSANFGGANSYSFGNGFFDLTSLASQHPHFSQVLDKSNTLASFDMNARAFSQETDAIVPSAKLSLGHGKREERSLSSRKDLSTGSGVSLSTTVGDKTPDMLLNGGTVRRKESDRNGTSKLKEPGKTIATARTIALTKQTRKLTEEVGKSDRVDFYRFDLLASSSFNLRIKEDSNRIDMVLLNASGQVVDEPLYRRGGELGRISRSLAAGTYYVKVTGKGDASSYQLSMSKEVGGSLSNAQLMPITATPRIWKDSVGRGDRADMYRFDLTANNIFNLKLAGLKTNVDVALLDSSGKIVQSSRQFGRRSEAISKPLSKGVYYVKVIGRGRDTSYQLDLSATPNPRKPKSGQTVENAGAFTVGSTGKVSFDYLLDGSALQGEVAIFNLSGMEQYGIGSDRYIQEAALRASRNSADSGYVVVTDQTEAARFGEDSGLLSFNSGDYVGSKTFTMNSGDQFGIMLIPNSTVSNVLSNPGVIRGQHPIFSMPEANTGGEVSFAQVISGKGNSDSFAFEDQSFTEKPDYDYNDLILQVKGATGQAASLDDVIEPSYDWRQTDLGKALLSYIQPGASLTNINQVSRSQTRRLPVAEIIDTQPDISDWLTSTRKSLADLKISGTRTLAKSLEDIYSYEKTSNSKLGDLGNALAQKRSNINKLISDGRDQSNTFLDSADSRLSGIDESLKPYEDAVNSVLDEFKTWIDGLDKDLYQSGAVEVLPELSNALESKYRLSYELDKLQAIVTLGTTSQDLSLQSSISDARKQVLREYDPTAADTTLQDDQLVQTLQNSITEVFNGYRNQLKAVKDAWDQWTSDSETLTEVKAKILSISYLEYANSLKQPIDKIGAPLIGIIDTGFRADDPDIDYSRIRLGTDWVGKDSDPLLQAGEVDTHGTQILDIIAATRNNQIGIDGLNDRSPIWLGRAVGSGSWGQSLIEFVDTAKAAKQQNAIVNLSFELTQTNPDGSVTPRYELTPLERAALTYAQQNHVLIVAAAGNDGKTLSALGKASIEFDNIIVVGAAEGQHSASYSNYGQGLDLLASVSIGGDRGTSIAAAQVAGAVSLIWTTNPQLNYAQVIDILKRTATDLDGAGWDIKTGTGLLNIPASIYLAKSTTPEPYISYDLESLKNLVEAQDIPEGDRSKLCQMYYYFDLEAKLTGESWKGTTGSTATERTSSLLGCFFSTVVGAVAGGVLNSQGPIGTLIGGFLGSEVGCGDDALKIREEAAAAAIAGANQNVADFDNRLKTALENYNNAKNSGLAEIQEAIENGKSPQELQQIRNKVANEIATAFKVEQQAQTELAQAKQDAAKTILEAEASIKRAEEEFGSSNIFNRLGTKIIGTFERTANWVVNLPVNTARLAKTIFIQPWTIKSGGDFAAWLGSVGLSITEVLPVNLAAETAADFLKAKSRPLSNRESDVAKSVFGDSINYSLVRIDENSYTAKEERPYTTFHTINSPGIMTDDTLIHELTHIWQYENGGPSYIPEALAAQGGEGYDYGDVAELVKRYRQYQNKDSQAINTFNPEQQAAIVQDYYRLRIGQAAKQDASATKADLITYAHYVDTVSEYSDIYLAFYAK